MQRRDFLASVLLGGPLARFCAGADEPPLRIATFEADVTPPLGSPLCVGLVTPAKEILDPLSARGIVLLGRQPPIVLCAVDWVMIANAAHDAWREALARAVGTTADRVAVHVVHQHNAPGVDYSAEKIMAAHGLPDRMYDKTFAEESLARVARAAGQAVKRASRVTHVGHGMGKVEKVASTRRVFNPDGTLRFWRSSSGGSKEKKAAPEGLIDPYVRLVSFWDGDRPLASLTYYACHPCALYGRGGVSSEIMGLARAARQAALPEVAHVHFNGAGGDIAVGKYNDNTLATRSRLAKRLAAGMKAAWETQQKVPVAAADVTWRTHPVALPIRKRMTEQWCLARIDNVKHHVNQRSKAARHLAWLRRTQAGHKIVLSCLRVGPTYTLHMPGELFVEYQLAAQKMRPDDFVSMAAYGDLGPTYIGTKLLHQQGGYEAGRSCTAPEVENVLMAAMRDLLKVKP